MLKRSIQFKFLSMIFVILTIQSFAASSQVNDVIISSRDHKNIIAAFTGEQIKVFPFDDAYGADYFWAKWDIIRNGDGTVSFKASNYYLSRTGSTVAISTTFDDNARFYMEQETDDYYIRSYDGYYLTCGGTGWKNISLSTTKSDNARWYLFETVDPFSGSVNDVNIYSHTSETIIGIFTGPQVKSYPYEDSYGPFYFWAEWDLQFNGDGSVKFHVGGNYLNVTDSILTPSDTSQDFTIEAANQGSYYIKDSNGHYMTTRGTGWKNVDFIDTPTDDSRWYFMNPIEGMKELGLPYAEVEDDFVTYIGANESLDGSASSDSDSGNALTYSWWLFDAPTGSTAALSNETSSVAGFSPDKAGDYIIALTVTDNEGYASTSHMTVTAYNDIRFEVSSTRVNQNAVAYNFTSFDATPVVLANMQTFNGTDTAGVRMYNVGNSGFTAFIEEETSQDSEIAHNLETLGFMAMNEGWIYDENQNIIGEAGRFNHTQTDRNWSTLTFNGSYNNPVVIMMMNTYNGGNESHMRLKSLSGTNTQYRLEEWSYHDGTHNQETIGYIVVEAGTHTLLNGFMLQAQTATADEVWTNVDFASSYSQNPVVISQSQTYNGSAEIVTRHNNITTAGLSVRVQEEEGRDGTHADETIGIISIGN